MIPAIQTYGGLLHWHPHFHTLVTCGEFTAEGAFVDVPELDGVAESQSVLPSRVSP